MPEQELLLLLAVPIVVWRSTTNSICCNNLAELLCSLQSQPFAHTIITKHPSAQAFIDGLALRLTLSNALLALRDAMLGLRNDRLALRNAAPISLVHMSSAQ